MTPRDRSVPSSLHSSHPGYLTVREIRSQVREFELAHAVAVAREELRLRGRPLEASTERSETAHFSTSGDEHGDSEHGSDDSRIPPASNAQQLWAQHKYSVLARDPDAYEEIGRRLARDEALNRASVHALIEELDAFLRQPPEEGRLINAVQHLWGYVNEETVPAAHRDATEAAGGSSDESDRPPDWDDPLATLRRIGRLAREQDRTYLLHSTALSDLSGWLDFLSDPA